jgi:hypothetical protein
MAKVRTSLDAAPELFRGEPPEFTRRAASPLFPRLFLWVDLALVVAAFVFLLTGAANLSKMSGYALLAVCAVGLLPVVSLQLAIAAVTNPVTQEELAQISELVTRRLAES